MMKRFARLFVMLIVSWTACASQVQYTVPLTVTPTKVFNAVSTAQASGCLNNQGQNIQFVFYQGVGATGAPTGVQIRLEGSFDSDSATCATGTWFAISDDGTDPGQNGTNLIVAIQSYPFTRLNLVKCSGTCNASNALTAFYTASSAMPGNPFGLYGAGQQTRKVEFVNQASGGSPAATTIVSPYGSTAGFVFLNSSATFTSGTLTARCLDFGTTNTTIFNIPAAGTSFGIPIASSSCVSISLRCANCNTTGAVTYSASYYFFPPGTAQPTGAQPANTSNTEATAVNATVTTTLTIVGFQRAHLFMVNARCSAGTAQLVVADGATTIFSTAATEVGTTSFRVPWNPALAGSPGNNLVITLSTCGGANTGTLDVQGSVF